MADVVDFKKVTKPTSKKKVKTNQDLIKELIQELFNQSHNVEDILIFVKDKAQDITLCYSTLSTQDKAFMLQMLQYDINEDFVKDDLNT